MDDAGALRVERALREAAEALAERLRARPPAKAARMAARRLLQSAFEALESGQASLPLARAVDAAAHPLIPRIPRPPQIGPRVLRGALDRALLARLWALDEQAEAILARHERTLSVLSGQKLRLVARAPVEKAPEERPPMELTRG